MLKPSEASLSFDLSDVSFKACRGTGAGGQHRNKTDSAIHATHRPTGISVFCQDSRSQHINKEIATERIKSQLSAASTAKHKQRCDSTRKIQLGSGMRGDKVRTVQIQNQRVTNHLNGKKITLNKYFKGEIQGLAN